MIDFDLPPDLLTKFVLHFVILDIPCYNLAFAAGVWTPQLFDKLFPNSNVTFCPTTDSGNWMIFTSPEQPLFKNTGQVILDDFVGHQLEFVGRADGSIWINGLDITKACLGNVKGSQEPEKNAILRYVGQRWRHTFTRCWLRTRIPIQSRDVSPDALQVERR